MLVYKQSSKSLYQSQLKTIYLVHFRSNVKICFVADNIWLFTKEMYLENTVGVDYILIKYDVSYRAQQSGMNTLHGQFSRLHKCNHQIFPTNAWINSLRPRQNGCHFAYDILLNLFFCSLINNMAALVNMMAWHRTGEKPLSEAAMMVYFTDAFMRHLASMR